MSMIDRLRRAGQQLNEGFRADYGIGGEDLRMVMRRRRELEGKQAEAPKMEQMAGAYQPGFRVMEAMGKATPEGKQARKENDMSLEGPAMRQVGQGLGTVAADITQDGLRRFYWLLNAAQATGEVINESVLAKVQPALYGKRTLRAIDEESGVRRLNKRGEDSLGEVILPPSKGAGRQTNDARLAVARGLGIIDEDNNPRRGFSIGKDEKGQKVYQQRNFEPGFVQALSIPTGIAINTGIGLMNPFGGSEGYKAAVPSEEDPSKTANVLQEVGLKYMMGRTGNLLPYDEFVKVRPDVSKDEYGRYKAFKFDKKEDWNPTDGDTTMFGGALKTTDEGIHGPELQFLGRSLPVTTGIVPYLGAMAGGALGVRTDRTIKHGFLGGLAGLTAGNVIGGMIENERRRRNTVENELDGTLS